ncbi:MAG: signal peptidase II [Deltaproteobacteria bacterium]|nr:signal peptidase II [Deltaproteobacteria bacterium]
MLIFIFPALLIIILDQLSKFLVASHIDYYESVPLINGFFNLVHVRNRGMAFGLMNRPDNDIASKILVFATVAAILFMTFWFYRIRKEDGRLVIGLSLIFGGAVGNLIDRIRLKEVIDFFDFSIGSYHWPAFNLADSAITIGTLWIIIHILFFNGPGR